MRLNHGTGINVSSKSVVIGNYVHDNGQKGVGASGDDVLYERNEIFHEISFAAVIRNNLVGQNGKDFAWLYGSQILISTSQDADVYGNFVEVPEDYGNGIGVIWQNRPPHRGTGNKLHDNDVTFLGDGDVWQSSPAQTGVAADFAPATTDVFSASSMNANKYHMKDTTTRHFAWNNATRTFAELQATGQELTGSVDSQVAPRSWSCALVDSTP